MSGNDDFLFQNQARERFFQARLRALREDWLARLTGKQNDLLPYEAVAHLLKSYQHQQYTELKFIPIDKIVGSVGRYRDFTRTFMPRAGVGADRWAHIDAAMGGLVGVPPIEVYQIGEVYFVADGNHRVSVARANGLNEIEAYVTVIPGDPGLEPGDTLDQAIIKAECTHFLAQTRLGERCGELDIHFTKPGGFTQLLEHIYAHRYFMSQERPPGTHIRFREAASDWYDNVYLPIIAAIRRQDLLRRFPGRTASDLYVWVSARMLELHEAHGTPVSPDEAARLVGEEARTPFQRTLLSLIRGLTELVGQGDDRPAPNMPGASKANATRPEKAGIR